MAPSSKKKRGTENNAEEGIPLDETKKKSFEKKVKAIKKNKGSEPLTPGTIYLGNIPHGFFEPQMKDFFSQFGKVTQLRLSRSKKSGRSKGYAFIEFECDDVAKIVAETMNNYLMFERLLKSKFVLPDECHPELWRGAKRKFKRPKSHILAIKRHNVVNQEKKVQSTARRFLKKHEKRTAALAEMGIELKVGSVTTAVKEAKKTVQSAKATEDKKDKSVVKLEKESDSKEVKTPKPKRQQTLEANSEPAKTRITVEKTELSTGKKLKSVKTPNKVSTARKRKLPI